MLVQQQKIPYICVFKTQAGEEFIGKVVEEENDSYRIKSPLVIVMTDKGAQFAPYMVMADPEKPIVVPKPLIIGLPEKKLQEQYEQSITPIQLIRQ